MSTNSAQMLIVYNADSGAVNAVLHALHKAFKPETYPCSLCALTYGTVSMHGQWKRFLDTLPLDIVFHHKDDFAEAYPGAQPDLPAILVTRGESSPDMLVPAQELDTLASLDGLIQVVEERLTKHFGSKMLAA